MQPLESKSWRAIVVATTVAVSVLTAAAPASANLENNPNAAEFGPVWCPDADLYVESLLLPAPPAELGVGEIVGVARTIWLTTADGEPLVQIFDTAGEGWQDITVWCYWANSTSPTGYAGGDIILNATLRP